MLLYVNLPSFRMPCQLPLPMLEFLFSCPTHSFFLVSHPFIRHKCAFGQVPKNVGQVSLPKFSILVSFTLKQAKTHSLTPRLWGSVTAISPLTKRERLLCVFLFEELSWIAHEFVQWQLTESQKHNNWTTSMRVVANWPKLKRIDAVSKTCLTDEGKINHFSVHEFSGWKLVWQTFRNLCPLDSAWHVAAEQKIFEEPVQKKTAGLKGFWYKQASNVKFVFL